MTRNDLIRKLEQCIADGESRPRPVVAGWIVGVTIADEDGYTLYEKYDDIRDVAEIAAELETMDEDDTYIESLWLELTEKISKLHETAKP